MVDNGAWCWFSDPRVLYSQSKDRTYVGWVSPTGDIIAKQIDHATGATKTVTVHANLQQDDHCNPGFLEMPDGRVYIFYAHHQASDVVYRWTGTNGDIGTLGGPVGLGVSGIIPGGGTFSYANPVHVPDGNRVMVFFRHNTSRNRWCVAVNENALATNSWAGYPLFDTGAVDSGPYFKAMANGSDAVDLLLTTDHPANAVSDVRYMRFKQEASGAKWQNALSQNVASVPFGVAQTTLVQTGSTVGNTWIWQVSRDAGGNPIALMSAYPGNSTTEHKYRFARWNGTAFVTSEICSAGGPLVTSDPPSRYYSGGICFDGNDWTKVYLSRQDANGWHLEQWSTADNGATWTLAGPLDTPITDGGKYVRPFSPKGYGATAPAVWCFKGAYTTYLNYNAALVSYGAGAAEPPEHTFAEGKVWKREDGVWFAGVTEPETEIA